ncbi:MAG: LPS export ABC transporter permease LptG [Thiotrichales bacterium]|nr:LPS export ABC transporter permease LptG [Thiotrichales bacterium]
MRILDVWIARHVVGGALLALAVLLSLSAVVGFVEELDAVGRGRYGIGGALEYVLLTMPRYAVVLFPLASVIGALIGLGTLAVSHELAVVRAAGVSVVRTLGSVLSGAVVLMVVAVVVGEVVAPFCERLAQSRRAVALGEAQSEETGYWIREGRRFINAVRVQPGDAVEEMYIYDIDPDGSLRTMTHATRAQYRDGAWRFESVRSSEISADGVVTRSIPDVVWETRLRPDLVRLSSARLESLSGRALMRYIDYLRENRLDTAEYELALWMKVVYPLATGVMIVLAVPLVLGRLGDSGIGQRILVGCLIAVTFHVVNQVSGKMGIVYGLNPALSAFAPTLLFLAVGVWLLRRVR